MEDVAADGPDGTQLLSLGMWTLFTMVTVSTRVGIDIELKYCTKYW